MKMNAKKTTACALLVALMAWGGATQTLTAAQP